MGNIVKSTEYQINYHNENGDVYDCQHTDRKPEALRQFEAEKIDLPFDMSGGCVCVAMSVEKVLSYWDRRDGNLEDREHEEIARYPEDKFIQWDSEYSALDYSF